MSRATILHFQWNLQNCKNTCQCSFICLLNVLSSLKCPKTKHDLLISAKINCIFWIHCICICNNRGVYILFNTSPVCSFSCAVAHFAGLNFIIWLFSKQAQDVLFVLELPIFCNSIRTFFNIKACIRLFINVDPQNWNFHENEMRLIEFHNMTPHTTLFVHMQLNLFWKEDWHHLHPSLLPVWLIYREKIDLWLWLLQVFMHNFSQLSFYS